jgi:hypothetical protein
VHDSIEIGHFLRSWDKLNKGPLSPLIRGIIARIVGTVQDGNDRWIELALDYLGVSEGVLRDYLIQEDSVLLANLIHYARSADCCDHFSFKVV